MHCYAHPPTPLHTIYQISKHYFPRNCAYPGTVIFDCFYFQDKQPSAPDNPSSFSNPVYNIFLYLGCNKHSLPHESRTNWCRQQPADGVTYQPDRLTVLLSSVWGDSSPEWHGWQQNRSSGSIGAICPSTVCHGTVSVGVFNSKREKMNVTDG